jgi:hypothetical protein
MTSPGMNGTHLFQQPAPISVAEWPSCLTEGGELTFGTWATEAEAAAELDAALAACGLWSVYSEVRGTLCQPRPAQNDKTLRIDRVLIPNQRLRGLGWAHGAIGVEIKRSGVKIGPPIAQAMDYSRTTWIIEELGGLRVWLDWVFIWPMPKQGDTVGSILAQNKIGSATASRYYLLHLQSGSGQNLITVTRDGEITIGAGASGRKAGSR